ncbi:hypothetical protein J6590_014883 [Homalodisca vitripennis]|nr:hypothetical protein J6590_014883 [Homalodisca vitripennis]
MSYTIQRTQTVQGTEAGNEQESNSLCTIFSSLLTPRGPTAVSILPDKLDYRVIPLMSYTIQRTQTVQGTEAGNEQESNSLCTIFSSLLTPRGPTAVSILPDKLDYRVIPLMSYTIQRTQTVQGTEAGNEQESNSLCTIFSSLLTPRGPTAVSILPDKLDYRVIPLMSYTIKRTQTVQGTEAGNEQESNSLCTIFSSLLTPRGPTAVSILPDKLDYRVIPLMSYTIQRTQTVQGTEAGNEQESNSLCTIFSSLLTPRGPTAVSILPDKLDYRLLLPDKLDYRVIPLMSYTIQRTQTVQGTEAGNEQESNSLCTIFSSLLTPRGPTAVSILPDKLDYRVIPLMSYTIQRTQTVQGTEAGNEQESNSLCTIFSTDTTWADSCVNTAR